MGSPWNGPASSARGSGALLADREEQAELSAGYADEERRTLVRLLSPEGFLLDAKQEHRIELESLSFVDRHDAYRAVP